MNGSEKPFLIDMAGSVVQCRIVFRLLDYALLAKGVAIWMGLLHRANTVLTLLQRPLNYVRRTYKNILVNMRISAPARQNNELPQCKKIGG